MNRKISTREPWTEYTATLCLRAGADRACNFLNVAKVYGSRITRMTGVHDATLCVVTGMYCASFLINIHRGCAPPPPGRAPMCTRSSRCQIHVHYVLCAAISMHVSMLPSMRSVDARRGGGRQGIDLSPRRQSTLLHHRQTCPLWSACTFPHAPATPPALTPPRSPHTVHAAHALRMRTQTPERPSAGERTTSTSRLAVLSRLDAPQLSDAARYTPRVGAGVT